MPQHKYRYKFYQEIYEKTPEILKEASKIGDGLDLGVNKGKIGLYTGSSSLPAPIPNYVLNEIINANKEAILPLRLVEDNLRNLVKEIWGDEYDAAATNSCESALRVSFETLFMPPMMRKGESYQGKYITPYEEDFDFMGFYGRPFPPKYKNLIIDRSASAGELGVEAKSLPNLFSLYVKLEGAKYEQHGIKYNTVPILTKVNAVKSFKKIKNTAERHIANLVGFETIGYDTPGYGYVEHDEKEIPILKKLIGNYANELDLPYLIDCASGIPSFGYSIKDVNADVMMWSMDKMVHAPTSGLIVGKEESMNPIRKGLGLGGHRYGEVSSHSKGAYSAYDPGRDAIIGQIAILKVLKDNPQLIKSPIDEMYKITLEEFKQSEIFNLGEGLKITRSYTMGGIEVNYSGTWSESDYGIPIFTSEDLFSNTNLIMRAIEEMGIIAPLIYSGNIFLGPGLGNIEEDGSLKKDITRMAIKGMVNAIELICKKVGVI